MHVCKKQSSKSSFLTAFPKKPLWGGLWDVKVASVRHQRISAEPGTNPAGYICVIVTTMYLYTYIHTYTCEIITTMYLYTYIHTHLHTCIYLCGAFLHMVHVTAYNALVRMYASVCTHTYTCMLPNHAFLLRIHVAAHRTLIRLSE